MTSKSYLNCVLIIKKLIEAKNFPVTSWNAVKHMIEMYVGADPRTVRKYKRLLKQFGFLYEDADGKVHMNLGLLQRELGGKQQLRLPVKKELTK